MCKSTKVLQESLSNTQWKDSHLGQGQVSTIGAVGAAASCALFLGLCVEQDLRAEAQVERGSYQSPGEM